VADQFPDLIAPPGKFEQDTARERNDAGIEVEPGGALDRIQPESAARSWHIFLA